MRNQLITGVEGTEEFLKIIEGDIKHNNLWMVERDSNNQRFKLGAPFNYVNQGQYPPKECYLFFWGSSNEFRSRSEEVDSMPIVWSPPVDSTNVDIHIRRGDSQSVIELHYALMASMGGVHNRKEEFCQRGFRFNGCGDSMLRGTMWLLVSWKERRSRLELMKRWRWRRRPPDVRWRSIEEMGGHPFKHGRKKFFEIVQSVSVFSTIASSYFRI